MRSIHVEIEGIAPLMFNRFTEKSKENMVKGTSGRKKTADEDMSSAMDKVHRDREGRPGIPCNMIKSALLRGSVMASLKLGKKGAQPFIRACVFFDPAFILLGREPDGVDERVGINNNAGKGTAVMLRRPIYNNWGVAFDLRVVDDRIPDSLVKIALEEAGLLVGIGAFRPDFGRFLVKEFNSTNA